MRKNKKNLLTEDEVLAMVRKFVQFCGSQTKAARLFGVSLPFLSDVLLGRRRLGRKLATHFRLVKVVGYQHEPQIRRSK